MAGSCFSGERHRGKTSVDLQEQIYQELSDNRKYRSSVLGQQITSKYESVQSFNAEFSFLNQSLWTTH